MKTQHRESFGALMTGIGELYGKSMSPELIAIYWDGLKDYEFDEVKIAINLHVRNPDTGQFMPKIADVVKFVEGGTLTQAMRAWQKVMDAVRMVGTYQTVVFDDPVIHAVISDMGGWQSIGQITDDDLPFKAREFEKRYQGYRVKPPTHYPRKLLGIFEVTNNTLGYRDTDKPVLLGNPERALMVLEKGADRPALAVQRLDDVLPKALIERKGKAA
jgi:hypothetical protein